MNLLEILERNLQQYLTIMINKKIVRQGIFVLFSVNNYYINLIIKNNKGENKVFEFPYPFKATQTDKRIILSYKNKEITGNKNICNFCNRIPTHRQILCKPRTHWHSGHIINICDR